MRKGVLTFLLLGIINFTYAQSDTLTAKQASTLIDKQVIVKAIVANARLFDTGMLLINLEEAYPNSPLTLVINKDVLSQMKIDEKQLAGKVVIAKGIVSVYRDRSQVVITKVEDLKY